jgi:glycosyltransferase involved in cell wall biosynthesis
MEVVELPAVRVTPGPADRVQLGRGERTSGRAGGEWDRDADHRATYIVGLIRAAATGIDARSPAVALLPWGDLFEDWLDSLGVDLDELISSFTGSWMFAWAAALESAGVRACVVAVTARVREPLRVEHRPSGATLRLLPVPGIHRAVARHRARGSLDGRRDPSSVGAALLAQSAPYLATPPLALRAALRDERCSAIVCQEYEAPRFDVCVALGRVLGLPVFATFQGGDYQVFRLERILRPRTMRSAAGFVVASRAEEARIVERYGVEKSRIARIFNPVDTGFWHGEDRAEARAELGLPVDAEVVAWHGQVHPRKGLDVLLRAWEAVRSSRRERDLRLVLVGRGEDDGVLREASRADGVHVVQEWVLDPTRLRRYLSAADVYAFPSRHEGFPVAPLEAMACGIPVVATAAQGIADIFEGGEQDGGVVVERDDVRRLAAELGALLDDEARRLVLGGRARRRAETAFALEPVGRALRAFLLDRTTIREGAGRGRT